MSIKVNYSKKNVGRWVIIMKMLRWGIVNSGVLSRWGIVKVGC